MLEDATLIAVSLPCLCELVSILRKGAGVSRTDVATAIRALLDVEKVAMDRPAVEYGLKLLEDGGDFADGVMAHEGKWLGAKPSSLSTGRRSRSSRSTGKTPGRCLDGSILVRV